MTREWLRFPFSANDQNRVVAGSATFQDGGTSFPNFLRMQFTVSDPLNGAPKIMPLFAGAMKFLADAPTPPLILPKPTDITTWTQAEYDTWQTVGTLRVTLDSSKVNTIQDLSAMPIAIPRVVWYWQVSLTMDFLFNSIAGRGSLQRTLFHGLVMGPDGTVVLPADSAWQAAAVSGFLNGYYEALVQMDPTDPAQDDAVLCEMPRYQMTTSGEVAGWVALATARSVDDGTSSTIATLGGLTDPLDPRHPANGLIHARRSLTAIDSHLIDGQPGSANALADALTMAWPLGPRYYQVRLHFPGFTEAVNACGSLVTEQVKITDASGSTLIQQQVSTNGIVTVAQAPPSPGTPLPAPPIVLLQFTPGTLVITDTTGDQTGLPPNEVRFDFAQAGDARAILQPPGPASASTTDMQAYSTKLATICLPLSRAPDTMRLTEAKLNEWASSLRPSTWLPSDEIFHGTRFPWSGVSQSDLRALFDALEQIRNPPIPIRPGDAMLLWLMEGRQTAIDAGIAFAKKSSDWLDFATFFSGMHPFGVATLDGATAVDIKRLARPMLLWNFFGLDIMTNSAVPSGGGDSRLVWLPVPGAPPGSPMDLGTSLAAHDAAMDSALQALLTVGITAPTTTVMRDCVEVRQNAALGHWEFRTLSSYLDTVLWLQHAEYLRRVVDLRRIVFDPAYPPDVIDFPAFGHIGWNGTVSMAANFWNQARAVLTGSPPSWVKTPEDALRSWPLTSAEQVDPGPPVRVITPRGSWRDPVAPRRSTAARVGGLHFGALAQSYGSVFPRVLLP
jgi:hypothetical protein